MLRFLPYILSILPLEHVILLVYAALRVVSKHTKNKVDDTVVEILDEYFAQVRRNAGKQ
jgi:hypothetical protein